MNFNVKLRLAVLGVAVALMGTLIILVTVNSQNQAEEVRDRLATLDIESFGLGDTFRNKLREAGNALQRYRDTTEQAAWDQFVKSTADLDTWMHNLGSRLNTPHELDLLSKTEAAYTDYTSLAETIHKQVESGGSTSGIAAQFARLRTMGQQLFDEGQALSRAHYSSRSQLVEHANQTLTNLRLSVVGLLALLFLFGIALATLVYRDMIAPLRLKLVESQALAERNEKLASLGLLAAGVAHEVRNPLTAVKAALFMQEKRFVPGTPEHDDIRVVEREILRLERIVNDFLQFARPTDPQMATIPAEQPLSEVQTFFAPQLARANIQLVLEPTDSLRIRADAGQIKQVLINLVRNAADSIGRNGTITLRARPERKRIANADTDVVVLEVADTGTGIPLDVEKRLFDPFFTTKENGTGLGLPIAARIVEKHGGSLRYQTSANQGTVFGVVLPRVPA
jgi:signal transduction histidine kinase